MTGALTFLLATFLAGALALVPADTPRAYARSIGSVPDQQARVSRS